MDYQDSATLLCLFEMRNDLFGDNFSEGVRFPLELRLDVQQPHKFLDVNKCIQIILATTANEFEIRWQRNFSLKWKNKK